MRNLLLLSIGFICLAGAAIRAQEDTSRLQWLYKPEQELRYEFITEKYLGGDEASLQGLDSFTMLQQVQSVDEDGNATIQVTIERYRFEDDEEFFDSKGGKRGIDLSQNPLLALVDATFAIVTTPRGEITSVTGHEHLQKEAADAMREMMMTQLAAEDMPPERLALMKKMQEGMINLGVRMVSSYLSSSSLAAMCPQSFAQLPERSMSIDGSWKTTNTIKAFEDVLHETTLTLIERRESGELKVSTNTHVSQDPPDPKMQPNPDDPRFIAFKMALKQLQGARSEGELLFDPERGVAIRCERTIRQKAPLGFTKESIQRTKFLLSE